MRDETLIAELRETMAGLATEKLLTPNRDARDMTFEYGHACGFYQGLLTALHIAESIIEQEKQEHDDDDQ